MRNAEIFISQREVESCCARLLYCPTDSPRHNRTERNRTYASSTHNDVGHAKLLTERLHRVHAVYYTPVTKYERQELMWSSARVKICDFHIRLIVVPFHFGMQSAIVCDDSRVVNAEDNGEDAKEEFTLAGLLSTRQRRS
jgi:L-ascorbate metabolism protein UlaG (beta-lactamase superfamily)